MNVVRGQPTPPPHIKCECAGNTCVCMLRLINDRMYVCVCEFVYVQSVYVLGMSVVDCCRCCCWACYGTAVVDSARERRSVVVVVVVVRFVADSDWNVDECIFSYAWLDESAYRVYVDGLLHVCIFIRILCIYIDLLFWFRSL